MLSLNISVQQEKNLRILAEYLLSDELKAEFSMRYFTGYSILTEDNQLDCGTVGCAVGHGPFAGIYKDSTETWGEYAVRVFGITSVSTGLYCWVFTSAWANYDNTAKGAGKRILYALKYGVPYINIECFKHIERMYKYIQLYTNMQL